jgi:nitroreductase
MEKPAITNMTLNPLLKKRWSPRSFIDKPVDNQTLQRLFEAARWAPSSSNEQPWRFIVGKKGTKTWDKIWETLVDFNQKWAKLAPVLVLSVGKKTSSKSNKPNTVYKYDVGQSVAYITFQAMHEGLYVHQMGGFDASSAAKFFTIPNDYEVITAFAIGYKGAPELLEDNFRDMEKTARTRIALDEMVFTSQFGETSNILTE